MLFEVSEPEKNKTDKTIGKNLKLEYSFSIVTGKYYYY